MAKRKASAKWFEEGDSHGAASKFGQLLDEAFADAVYRFIGRYLREHYPAYSLLEPAEGKKLVQLAMLGGTSRQMDSVIVPRNSTDPVQLLDETELLLVRDISYTETAALAKEAEEALQFRDMQRDIVQQTMRRLAAVTLP